MNDPSAIYSEKRINARPTNVRPQRQYLIIGYARVQSNESESMPISNAKKLPPPTPDDNAKIPIPMLDRSPRYFSLYR